jgi:3-hydroxy-5-phosphonooxypentane-2,4-dione thiolase
MGRNVFQSEHPHAMLEAIGGIVHGGLNAAEALGLFEEKAGVKVG